MSFTRPLKAVNGFQNPIDISGGQSTFVITAIGQRSGVTMNRHSKVSMSSLMFQKDQQPQLENGNPLLSKSKMIHGILMIIAWYIFLN